MVFTDLDASLLNEEDYDWRGAEATLRWLADCSIPVVLASSKTTAEMRVIASEIGTKAPLICENGGSIAWPDGSSKAVATPREQILAELDSHRDAGFQFRSFRDLGIDGVCQSTGLSPEQAAAALQRHATEPLLWDDTPEQLDQIRDRLAASGLTITRGGRFWHVAGEINKATAMRDVVEWYPSPPAAKPVTVAIGDSPNDQQMLEQADRAILIPDAQGHPKMKVDHAQLHIARRNGSAGWGEAVRSVVESVLSASD